MESSPSSRLSFFTESGAIIPCPVEGRKCNISIDIPKELWPGLSLKLGTVLLALRLDDAAKCAHSEWPACGPGDYELSLECGDLRERRTITVVPENFTVNDFISMIRELAEVLPTSIASQLQECAALSGTNLALDHEPTIRQEFFKLRGAIAGTKERLGILQLLPIIQRECNHVLVPQHELRQVNKVRRPDIKKLPQAMSMPDNIIFSTGTVKQMFDVIVEPSFETYENRLVKAYVQALQSQMSRLQARLESEAAPPAIASDLEALAGEFRLACTRAAFLRQVRLPFESAGRVTMVLLKNPAYRAVFEDYLAIHKQSSVRLEEPALRAPLNKFPFLYQLWVNLKVVSVVLQVCAESGYQCVSHHWVKKDNKGLSLQVMYDDEPAIELSSPTTGRGVRVLPWRTDNASEDTRSTSPEQPPGLAIAIYNPAKPPVVLLFDPKYKVADSTKQAVANEPQTKAKTKAAKNDLADALAGTEPMKEDIDELLLCMDQIRTPEGVREIQYAVILYPGQSKQIAPDLEALSARPSDGEALQKNVYDLLRRYLA